MKADPPLFVDADTQLSIPVAGQPFKLVIGRNPKEGEGGRSVNLHQLAPGNTLNIIRKPCGERSVEYLFRLFAAK